MIKLQDSEMPLSADGSVYHLNLHPEDVAPTVLLVGDPGRVPVVSSLFDTIEVKKQNRELHTHTGYYKGKRVSVLSTGMGTDNIDIVINELDALVNIDLQKKCPKDKHTALKLVRMGTCGGLQADLGIDTLIASQYALGLDGLLHYYRHNPNVRNTQIEQTFVSSTDWNTDFSRPYCVAGSELLINQLAFDVPKGITLTASGFYAPQCRVLRMPLAMSDFTHQLQNVEVEHLRFANMEMETSALYALSRLMGHHALTICVVIANRVNKTFSKDYHPAMEKLAKMVLDRI